MTVDEELALLASIEVPILFHYPKGTVVVFVSIGRLAAMYREYCIKNRVLNYGGRRVTSVWHKLVWDKRYGKA